MKFRKLDEKEKQEFRQERRKNYKPFSPIQGIWHPVAQIECVLINMEYSELVEDRIEVCDHCKDEGGSGHYIETPCPYCGK